MKKTLLFTLSLIFIGLSCLQAQTDTPFEKKYFKNKKDAFKTARDQVKAGDALYDQGAFMFSQALPYYLKAEDFNPNNSVLNYRIGRCTIGPGSSFKAKSLSYFAKAYKLNPQVAPDILFYLAWAEQLNYKFDDAIVHLKKYQTSLSGGDKEEMAKTKKHLMECSYGKKYMRKPDRVFIDNIGRAINTKYPEYGDIINADETLMLFTSRRPSTTGGGKDPATNEYFEDIYFSVKKNGVWQPAENIGPPINTKGHDATVAISPDGQKMIVYKDEKGNGNLWESKLEGTSWSAPKRMDKGTINTKSHESSASYSPDGKTLYFVSNRKGGLGGRDIWKSTWNDEKGKWGEAINLGPTINTQYNEESVFMHPDGKTLYFSSQGHTSMGGYDIFKSVNRNGHWTTPVDMGYPINTPDDDVFFVLGASGHKGYYSSIKKGGFGEKDIYVITFLGPEKPDVVNNEDNLIASDAKPIKEHVFEKQITITTKRITLLKGFVKEYGSLKPIKAQIELIDLEDNTILATFSSNASTGKYLISLPSGKNYALNVRAPGYLFYSDHFNIPDSAAYQEITRNILLQKLEVGSKVVLKNIFYDYNKATLRKESMGELDRVIKLLQQNPTLKIELSAYTDQRGGNSYNLNLSQERAQSCVDYLTNHGIAKNRLVAKGYGEADPINSMTKINNAKTQDEKEELYQQNRRTEIKVIAK